MAKIWTPLRTWTTGEVATPAMFNAQLRDNLDYTGDIAYVEFTADVSVTGTAFVDVVSSGVITYAATPIMIEFYARAVGAGGSGGLTLNLRDSTTDLGRFFGLSTNGIADGVYVARKLTPSAASHTYVISAQNLISQTSTVYAGAGGAGNYMPGFIRIRGVPS